MAPGITENNQDMRSVQEEKHLLFLAQGVASNTVMGPPHGCLAHIPCARRLLAAPLLMHFAGRSLSGR